MTQSDESSVDTDGKELQLCDFYLFQGKSDTTVMAMTVNPHAGVLTADRFEQDIIYAFRFDLDGDGSEEVSFKIQVKEQFDKEAQKRLQTFTLRRAEGSHARAGGEGEIIATGGINEVVKTSHGVSVFAGLRPDLFAANKEAMKAFLQALDEGKYAPDAFHAQDNTHAGRNVMAIVVEVPGKMIGDGQVHGWATISESGPEKQICRRGLPLLSEIFFSAKAVREEYNQSKPSEDEKKFAGEIDRFIARVSEVAGLTTSPSDYAKKVGGRLIPSTLPYKIGSPAAFTQNDFNGRALADNVLDVMLDLATNTTVSDGVMPDKSRMQIAFPYFGDPYTKFDLKTEN